LSSIQKNIHDVIKNKNATEILLKCLFNVLSFLHLCSFQSTAAVNNRALLLLPVG